MSDCCICLEKLDKINDKENIIELDCKHKFHYKCISKITNNSCPLCRKKIVSENICNGNHKTYFYASYYKKNGDCRHCSLKSYNYYLKKK